MCTNYSPLLKPPSPLGYIYIYISNRTRVRTGTSPPSFLKDLYNRLFWYGFDPDITTTAADKTMFGGTRGKFNGLALLQDAESDSSSRGRRRNANEMRYPRGRRNRDMNYDDVRRNRRRQVIVDLQDDEDEYDYEEYELWNEDSKMYEDKVIDIDDERIMRIQDERRIRDLATERLSDDDEKNPLSEERSSPLSLNRNVNDNNNVENLLRKQTWNRVMTRKTKIAKSVIPKQSRQLTLAKKRNSIPIFGIMDKVFQIDDSEINARAADYDRSINWSSNSLKSQDASRRRKGFAYPYEEPKMTYRDESEDEPVRSDSEIVIDVDASMNATSGEVSKDPANSAAQSQSVTNRPKWIDRADADEKVPPKEVMAWVSLQGDYLVFIITYPKEYDYTSCFLL